MFCPLFHVTSWSHKAFLRSDKNEGWLKSSCAECNIKMSVRQIILIWWLVPAGQRDMWTGRVLLASFKQRSKQWVTHTTMNVWRTVRVVRLVLISTLFYLVYRKIINFSLQAHFLEIFCKSYLEVKSERSEMEGFCFGFFFYWDFIENYYWEMVCWQLPVLFSFVWVCSAVHWLVVLFYGLHEIIFCIWYVLI